MNKIAKLRSYLLEKVVGLNQNPDRLLIFVDDGKPCSPGDSLSFEYDFTANVVITEFGGHADEVMVPIIAWYKKYQPDITVETGVSFIADILNHSTVDLSLKLKLTERVIVTTDSSGNVTNIHHCDEPPPSLASFPWSGNLNGQSADG